MGAHDKRMVEPAVRVAVKPSPQLSRGYNCNSTLVRRPLDCLSKVIKVTVTYPASRSHADLFIYLGRSAAVRS